MNENIFTAEELAEEEAIRVELAVESYLKYGVNL